MVSVTSRSRLVGGVLIALIGAASLAPAAVAQERVLRVPQDYATVQGAVDAAGSGDLVLIDKGVYNEFVQVVGEEKANLTIRGVDRNAVQFDGKDELPMAIMVKQADNVRLENMTAHNYTGNGFYWQSVEGYVGRYITTWNVGVYGIYAFDSRLGLFQHTYASGSDDSSYYIGQCYPCDATISDVTAEYSILGYSGTNAGGNLAIEDSLWHLNGAGIVPNSLDSELYPPQREAVIRRNTVTGSGSVDVPARGFGPLAYGIGIVIAGGAGNVVEDNVVTDSTRYGIVITPLPDQNVWQPVDNTVRNNTATNNHTSDPLGADLAIVGTGSGNCFEGNTFETSDPPEIESLYSCSSPSLADSPVDPGAPITDAQLILTFLNQEVNPRDWPPYTDMPKPPDQPTMPADEAGKGIPGGPREREAAMADGTFDAPQAPTTMDINAATPAAPSVAPAVDDLPATGAGLGAILGGIALVGSSLRLRRRD